MKNMLGGTYSDLANFIFPRGCECPDDSGSCNWCHVYYGWFDREQMFALGMEKAADLIEHASAKMKRSTMAKMLRDCSWLKEGTLKVYGLPQCSRCKEPILHRQDVTVIEDTLIHTKCMIMHGIVQNPNNDKI